VLGVAAGVAVMVMSDRIGRRRREVAEGWARGRHAELDAELTLRLPDGALDALADAVADRLAERQAPVADAWLDTRAAASYLGLSVHAVHRLVARREVPYSQDGPGARCYFKRSALDAWRGG
jgi:excisionase family DNA binding protein